MAPGNYKVKIDTTLFSGRLDYGELLIRGASEREVFFSTYICHPSMANNELSGPVLAVALARYLESINTHYSYRFIFIPETIGSLAYMSKNLEAMKKDVVAGFVLTCVGDERGYSYLPSRSGEEVSDKVALSSLEDLGLDFVKYSWADRGSDERQYCSPGADLPVCSVMRSKYGEYPEYHTSLDRLDTVVTEIGLQGSYDLYRKIISTIEDLRFPIPLTVGEPQLGKKGLYPNTSIKDQYGSVRSMMNVLSQCDGKKSVEEIAATCRIPLGEADEIIGQLNEKNLLSI
jgi:aminopeptidase-like protein